MSARKVRNNVRALREQRLLSKAELARRAGVSPLTVQRIEGGAECRVETKRKIILALGMTIEQREEVFPVRGSARARRDHAALAANLRSDRKVARSKEK